MSTRSLNTTTLVIIYIRGSQPVIVMSVLVNKITTTTVKQNTSLSNSAESRASLVELLAIQCSVIANANTTLTLITPLH
jgi:hypothetical protein